VVESGREDLELAGKNDEELFAVGTAAYAAGDHRRAAAAFARLADLFPRSPRLPTALFDAGLAYERTSEWRLALERFRALAGGFTGPDADEAAFRSAECLYNLRQLAEARALLDGLAARKDLALPEHLRALVQRGVVELEAGDREAAERSLRLATSAWQDAKGREELDDYYPAQAQFYLGELYRGHFQAIQLRPEAGDEARLGRDLEAKAEMLLSAQGHYLRAIKVGNPQWTVAAGARIGELYDELHAQLTGAPLPPGLDAEHARAYRAELARKVRVLVTKAIGIYEQTLAAARRTGVDNEWVERTRRALERMRAAVAEGYSGS
jgi:tetratricopeptide (TPR) repeat protein